MLASYEQELHQNVVSLVANQPVSLVCSLFMSSARPRPSHHPLLILFVVGGVTCAEVRQIQDIAASHKTNVRVGQGVGSPMLGNSLEQYTTNTL